MKTKSKKVGLGSRLPTISEAWPRHAHHTHPNTHSTTLHHPPRRQATLPPETPQRRATRHFLRPLRVTSLSLAPPSPVAPPAHHSYSVRIPAPRAARAAAMAARTKFAVIDCEDAPKWAGHESIWVAAYGRPGEHWCAARRSGALQPCSARGRLSRSARTRCNAREHFRAYLGELPEESELDSYQGMCITGRRVARPAVACAAPRLKPCGAVAFAVQPLRRARRDQRVDRRAVRLPAGASSARLALDARPSDTQRVSPRSQYAAAASSFSAAASAARRGSRVSCSCMACAC